MQLKSQEPAGLLSSALSKAWQWTATGYIVLLPCLYWEGLLQDQALAVAYPVCTVMLAALSLALRKPPVSVAAFILTLGSSVSVLFNMPETGFPVLILHMGLGLLAYIGLSAAPSSAWLLRRIVWLAVLNVLFAWGWMAGYSPILDSSGMCGLFSTRNQLGLLLLAAFPLCGRWLRAMLAATALAAGSWTACVGMGLWWLMRRMTALGMGLLLGIGTVALLGLQAHVPGWDTGRLYPRMLVWKQALSEALWSPLWGYGLGHWEARHSMTLDAFGPWFYNGYLAALHTGGILCLAPLLWLLWRIFRSPESAARSSLLLLAFAGLLQTPLHHMRMVIVTIALLTAWKLKETA